MSNPRFTKNEFKRQKEQLKRFRRYLPTLVLKMRQLKVVLNKIERQIERKQQEHAQYLEENRSWIALFGQPVDFLPLIRVQRIDTSIDNIAGVEVPNFICIDFEDRHWDLYQTPLWTDAGVRHLKRLVALDAELNVLTRQRDLIAEDLLTTTQRVNLFEKVRIPETESAIRMIGIYLDDQQTNAVVRGKIAKRNLVSGRAM